MIGIVSAEFDSSGTGPGSGDAGLDFLGVFLVDVTLATDALLGSEIINQACVDIAFGPQDTCASASITVTAPETTVPPVVTTTIAPAPPRLGERVVTTITVSGTAAAGATFDLSAKLGNYFLPGWVSTVAVSNVTNVAVAPGFPSHITSSVPEAGAYEATFVVDAWVSFSTPRNADLVATACVTTSDATGPVCTSATVQRQPTYGEILIDHLLAILRGLFGW